MKFDPTKSNVFGIDEVDFELPLVAPLLSASGKRVRLPICRYCGNSSPGNQEDVVQCRPNGVEHALILKGMEQLIQSSEATKPFHIRLDSNRSRFKASSWPSRFDERMVKKCAGFRPGPAFLDLHEDEAARLEAYIDQRNQEYPTPTVG